MTAGNLVERGPDSRPDVRPIYDAVDRALQDELEKWTYDVPDEFRMALSRAVVKRLQEGSMLNYDRPWEIGDQFGDVLAQTELLHNADPDCDHEIVDGDNGSGIKCAKCPGWYCA